MSDLEMQWEHYKKAGFDGKVGFGKSPAILVVDFQTILTTSDDPFGADMTNEVLATRKLLDVARAKKIPVLYSIVQFEEQDLDASIFAIKVPSLRRMKKGLPGGEIDSRLGKLPEELVITKKFQSSFAGTHLNSILTYLHVDTLIVTGCVVSGCVRATVCDSMQNGYRTIVPKECVGDRAKGSADYSLFDMATKMADVLGVDEVITYLNENF